ncbi:MAG: hypothetical protein COT17_07265 [Elusimicrobia bacterium CG08_land_8_20_14_0_20_51_18]|nr:MAG: hypothetical protein COT17_07265 [Elusimicrobia bacterium CG08_land_8_20_14_0_20_51_18]
MSSDFFPSSIGEKAGEYFGRVLGEEDSYRKKILERMREKGVRMINITPFEGNIISTYVRALNPRKGVEIGTLCGYSAMWLLRAMDENSRLYTIEKDPLHYNLASQVFEENGLSKRVIMIQDEALDALEKLSKLAPFDFCLIDADKDAYPDYLKWCLKNLRSGGLMIAHNPFLKGELFYEGEDRKQNKKSRGMREFLHLLFKDENFSSYCVIPSKDGLAVGVRK